MTRLMRFSTCVAGLTMLALAMTGCDSSHDDKLPHIKMVTVSHPVVFKGSQKQLSQTEWDHLNSFMQSVPVTAISYVGIEADDENGRAVKRAKQIEAYLVKQGVDQNVIHLQPSPDSDSSSMLLTVEYSVAVPPAPCPDWSKNSSGSYSYSNGSDFGCAYYNNYVVQLSNPADYNGGQGAAAVTDATRSSVLVQKYRTAAPSAAPSSSGSSSSSSSAPATLSAP